MSGGAKRVKNRDAYHAQAAFNAAAGAWMPVS